VVVSLALLAMACGGGGDGFRIERAELPTQPPTATPTADPNGDDSTPTPTPTPLLPSKVPEAPQDLLRGSDEIERYLTGGLVDFARCLPELVAIWQFSSVDGTRCVSIDVDGDEGEEFVLLITTDGDEPEPAQRRGDVWFYDDAEADHRIFASARALANRVLTGVAIREVADLTGDGLADVLISSETCGGTTCITDLVIASGERGEIENLAPDGIAMPGLESLEIETVEDEPEIVLRGGLIVDASAGPQRPITRRVRWTGFSFVSEDELDEPQYLIHLIGDADAAFAELDFAKARALYEQAARDLTLIDWKQENGLPAARGELIPYAFFRAALSAQRLGDGLTTLELLDRAFLGHGNSMHGVSALLYKTGLDNGRSATASCGEVESYLSGFADAYALFWDYGTANPSHPIDQLCR
jgi:hypothetical protein